MVGNIGPSLIGRAKHMLHFWGVGQKRPLADERPFWAIQRKQQAERKADSREASSTARQAQPEPYEVTRRGRRRRFRLPFRR